MISLKDLLKVPSLSELTVIAGANGLDRKISTVTLLDAPDGPGWLTGGEFVLTSAYIFDNNYDRLEEYIMSLIEKQAGGLGIKTGRFLSEVPDRIVELAGEHRFPIVQIPYNLVWTDIISPFYKLKYGLYDHNKPIAVDADMVLPLFEAGRWGGKQLLLQMTEMFQLPIAVYRHNKTPMLNNGMHGVHQIEAAAAELKAMPERGHPELVAMGSVYCIFFCLPPSYNKEREYLAVASEREGDIEELRKLFELLERLGSKETMAFTESEDIYRALLHNLVTSDIAPEEIEAFEENVRGKRSEPVFSGIMIVASEDYLHNYEQLREVLDLYQQEKRVKLVTYLYDHFVRKQAVVLWEIYGTDKRKVNGLLRGLIPLMEALFPETQQGDIAFSSASDSLTELGELYEQARQSLKFGALLWRAQHCHYYPDYAVYILLEESDINRIPLDECMLLLEDKSTMAFNPIDTAEAYIESGSYKRAAARLYIHENTLRYRINKISELLNIDLENPVDGYRFLTKIKLWKIHLSRLK